MKKAERRNITRKTLVIIAVMLVIWVATKVPAMAVTGLPKGSTAYVNVKDFLNMRAEPKGEIIGKIAKGEKVTILSGPDRNSYYQIRVDKTGEVCYVYGEYLVGSTNLADGQIQQGANQSSKKPNKIPEDTSTGTYMIVVSDKKLNLREGPDKKKNRVRYLSNGEWVEVLDTNLQNGYIKVMAVNDGKKGYVDIKYLQSVNNQNNEPILDNTVQTCTCNCTCGCECHK